jgi:hypothetical protein
MDSTTVPYTRFLTGFLRALNCQADFSWFSRLSMVSKEMDPSKSIIASLFSIRESK